MNWNAARNSIGHLVRKHSNLATPLSSSRFVLEVGPIRDSRRYGYHGESGFRVSIAPKAHVNIPWSMLKECFICLSFSGEYDGVTFRRLYGKQAKDHPCHVHIVGQIFVHGGLAHLEGRTYLKNW